MKSGSRACRTCKRWAALKTKRLKRYSETMPDQTNEPSRCPICKKPVPAGEQAQHFPFCSKRCRQIDLGKWFQGDYQISRPIEQRDLEEGVD